MIICNTSDNFIGNTRTLHSGAVQTVTGKKDSKGYYIHCSVCSLDEELWPKERVYLTLTQWNENKSPCGCSKSPKYKDWQYEVLCKRKASELGYEFLGWGSEWKAQKTKIKLYNPKTGNTWNTTNIQCFIFFDGQDPSLRGSRISKNIRIPDEKHFKDFEKSGVMYDKSNGATRTFIRNEVIKSASGGFSHWDVTCSICSNDEYVQEGVCSGVFTTYQSNLKRGDRPCRCSPTYKYSEGQRVYQLSRILKEESCGKFISLPDNYSSGRDKFKWLCSIYNNENHTCINSFIFAGNRCFNCNRERLMNQVNGFGYYPERAEENDYLYILNFNNCYIKVGRSFNIRERIRNLKRFSGCSNIEILNVFTGKHKNVICIEKYIHSVLREEGYSSDFNWSCELFNTDSYELSLKLADKSILKEHLNGTN